MRVAGFIPLIGAPVLAALAALSPAMAAQPTSVFPPARWPIAEPPARAARAALPSATSCSTQPCIYVANVESSWPTHKPTGNVVIFPTSAHGDVTPQERIDPTLDGLDWAWGVAVDSNYSVYVASTPEMKKSIGPSRIVVYNAGTYGKSPPARTIEGSYTGLFWPDGLAVDANGYIYVANGSNTILVFAPGANGNVAPAMVIGGSNTGLSAPTGVALDSAGNIYVANFYSRGGSVTVYPAGSNGNVTPMQTISGSNPGWWFLSGIALDASDNIYVANQSNVLVFAAGANGNASPIRNIGGSNTRFGWAWGVAVDANGNLYVADHDKYRGVDVFAPGADGDVSPEQVITGRRTGLFAPQGIAVR